MQCSEPSIHSWSGPNAGSIGAQECLMFCALHSLTIYKPRILHFVWTLLRVRGKEHRGQAREDGPCQRIGRLCAQNTKKKDKERNREREREREREKRQTKERERTNKCAEGTNNLLVNCQENFSLAEMQFSFLKLTSLLWLGYFLFKEIVIN